ncbi:MAG: TIGR04141 family sporadically distributed protein [Streptococcus salivarius]|nr:TIGR04141 family sporadically distributed protein [Streptococcus salivarius]
MKTRPFSIYLLKDGYNANNSLKQDHGLQSNFHAQSLPAGSSLFISDKIETIPWWVDYFNISGNITQKNKGALIFLPVKGRVFALCFGHVYHNLLDVSYEYDFGLRVTLNSLDPKELKSADIVDPGAARRKRTQLPITNDLTYLDFDSNSEILKSLTGKVKEEHSKLFSNATGSASLKVGLKTAPEKLNEICEKLIDLYISDDYLEAFPNIQKISPEKDPARVKELDNFLLESFKRKDENLELAIPDIVDYRDNIYCTFKGIHKTLHIYSDINIENLYDYIGDKLGNITLDDLKKLSMDLCNTEGLTTHSFSVYRCMIFDKTINNGDQTNIYHMCDGDWYKVDADYLQELSDYINGKCIPSPLPDYDHDIVSANQTRSYSEAQYNSAIPVLLNEFICLDQTDISPDGYSQIEPCDLITYENNLCVFYHIKISSRSSQLSHLFNQGSNSIELLLSEPQCSVKLLHLVNQKGSAPLTQSLQKGITQKAFKVIYGVITRKPQALASDNLPLFSKISLRRNFKFLELMRTDCKLTFINDVSPAKESYSQLPKVHVIVNVKGKKVSVIVDDGQIFAAGTPVTNCPKEIREAGHGEKFSVHVKKDDAGKLTSHHTWQFKKLN